MRIPQSYMKWHTLHILFCIPSDIHVTVNNRFRLAFNFFFLPSVLNRPFFDCCGALYLCILTSFGYWYSIFAWILLLFNEDSKLFCFCASHLLNTFHFSYSLISKSCLKFAIMRIKQVQINTWSICSLCFHFLHFVLPCWLPFLFYFAD